MRTDNQNVLNWAARTRWQSPASNRALRQLQLYCWANGVDILPLYIRIEQNRIADGLARRSERETDQRPQQEGMHRVNAESALWGAMALSYDSSHLVDYRPSNYAMLGGSPLLFPHLYQPDLRLAARYLLFSERIGELVYTFFLSPGSRNASVRFVGTTVIRKVSMFGEKDMYFLSGCCEARTAIRDSSAIISQRRPRYADALSHPPARGGAETNLRTSRNIVDCAMAGDHWASLRGICCSGGLECSQIDLSPSGSEDRVLNEPYRLSGLVLDEAPTCMRQTHTAPGSVGRASVIAAGGGSLYSKHPHLPIADDATLRGAAIGWPLCTRTGFQPPHMDKLVILGGHIALVDERMGHR